MVKTSYELSLLLARKKKAYSDGEEIIKNSLAIFAKNVGDVKIKNMVDNIALYRNTVMRRIDDMGQDVVSQIISGLKSCKFFSLALDEICDNTEITQLSIFVRYTNDNFENAEELLDLRQLVTTTGEDIFQQLKNVIEVNKVERSKLDSVCTDGAPCMVGRLKGNWEKLASNIPTCQARIVKGLDRTTCLWAVSIVNNTMSYEKEQSRLLQLVEEVETDTEQHFDDVKSENEVDNIEEHLLDSNTEQEGDDND
ncbi:zinc finger BED domain-containing protein 5-like [Diabrotica undecimpunctata]|uniref:zinc finger BED domain-containing protein 5-like n=1 Tax=Diabrotica undecimpunctata TaxID=50387 RepID=UPI003B63F0FC